MGPQFVYVAAYEGGIVAIQIILMYRLKAT
jgi:hypothetical protein